MGGSGADDAWRGDVFSQDAEQESALADRRQRPMEVDSARYYETGRAGVAVGKDGMPVMVGDPPVGPEPGLTHENLVCTDGPGRAECEHYVAVVLPADGVARGFGELRQIRRFCKRLSTAVELFEITGNIYGCTARSPQDLVSLRVIRDFETKQREAAAEQAETNLKTDL